MSLKSLILSDVDDVFFVESDFAEEATYSQGTADPVTVTVIVYDDEWTMTDEEHFGIKAVEKAVLVPVASLVGVTPRPGDTISRTLNGVSQTLEVVPRDSSRPAVKLDETGAYWKLEVKKVA